MAAKPSKDPIRISRAEFAAGAAKREQIPPPKAPEIAFAGRSNVGKSSLLNMLLSRKSLARTSSTPGCTRQINFFDVAIAKGPELVFVDLPGYGYAKVSKAEARDWKALLEGYLRERVTLRCVVILVDARRGIEDEERDLVEFLGLRKDLEIVVCATKLDKVPRSQQRARLQAIAKDAGVPPRWIVGTSSATGEGRDEVWERLLRSCTVQTTA
jgi:GTP-binding protein